MNWNIFSRLRIAESNHLVQTLRLSVLTNRVEQGEVDHDTTDASLGVLIKRVAALEAATSPAAIKAAAEKLTASQAYRRAYYQKRKAALAKLAELRGTK